MVFNVNPAPKVPIFFRPAAGLGSPPLFQIRENKGGTLGGGKLKKLGYELMTKFITNRCQQKPFLFYFHPFPSRRRGSLQFAAISF